MKIFLTTVIAGLLTHAAAFADWTIVQKSTSDGTTQEIALKVKGEKARSDVSQQMSVIVDGTSGNIVLLMHQQKAMMKMSGDALKSMMALAGNALGGTGGPPAKPVATGQMEKVGEYDTEIYTWSGKIGSGKFWVAKNFPQAEELNQIQDKIMKAMGNPTAAFAPAASDFPGMVVKSEMTMMGKKVETETVSIKEEPLDDALFALPTDYQEMKMPSLPGLAPESK